MDHTDIIVLVLVFAAAAWCTWVVAPLIMLAGLERTEGRYIKTDPGVIAPIYRFTTPERLQQACWSAAILGGGLVGFVFISAGVVNLYALLAASVMGGLLTFQIPKFWLNHRIKARKHRFDQKLMDLTLGLASGLRAGAAFPQSLELVARDLGGPMQEELGLVLHEYRLGVDLPEALTRLYLRMPGEDLLLLITSVRLTMQSGGSLAEVLDRITDTVRSRTEFTEKLRTMTAQGRFEAIAMASAPLVAFGTLFFLDRELMQPMLENKIGWAAMGLVAVLETIGFVVINKIVTIEV